MAGIKIRAYLVCRHRKMKIHKQALASILFALTLPISAAGAGSRLENYYYYLKQTASEAMQFDSEAARNWYESLPDLKIKENVESSVEKLKELLSQPPETAVDKNDRSNRMLIERLGRTRISRDGKTLNEYAQDAIERLFQRPGPHANLFCCIRPQGIC